VFLLCFGVARLALVSKLPTKPERASPNGALLQSQEKRVHCAFPTIEFGPSVGSLREVFAYWISWNEEY
jgi:hypothetical protein